jgi:hypothetical protein
MGLARAAGSLWGSHVNGPGLSTIASAYDAVATIAAPYDAAAETAALEEAAAALVLDDDDDGTEDASGGNDAGTVSLQYSPSATNVDGPERESLNLAAALSISEGIVPSYINAWQRANVSPGQSLCVPGAVYHITRKTAGALGSGGGRWLARRVPASSMALIVPSRTAISDHAAGDSYCAAVNDL